MDQLKKNCSAPEVLELKEGAKVILLKNLDLEWGLVNGSRGTVVRFAERPANPDDAKAAAAPLSNSMGGDDLVPVVAFRRASDGATREMFMEVEPFTVESGGREVAKRVQLPLKLAWAISIHKSQGMTIDCLEVDLEGCFEYGQAYVALSRATSFDELRIINFSARCVKAHPKVVEFYRGIGAL